MNKKMIYGMGIFFALIITLLAASTYDATAQSILNGNSTSDVSIVSYLIDIAELGLSDSHLETMDNSTSTITITNITNTVEYSCITIAGSNMYSTSGIAPSLNYTAQINQSISPSISDGWHTILLNCSYYINVTTAITNITENSTTTDTFLVLNTSKINSDKMLFIDANGPSIASHQSNVTIYNTTAASFGFTISDLSQANCTIIGSYNNTVVYSSQVSVAGLNGSNSTNVTASINVSQVHPNTSINYTFNITCIDSYSHYNSMIAAIPVFNATISDNANNTNITPEILFLNVTTSKNEFGLGEIGHYTINANNNSNVTITICPVAIGWVQCFVAPTFVNDTFPKTQALPYTNKTGKYLVQAVMNYKNQTATTNVTYETINTLTASITINPGAPGEGDTVIFNSTASGGVGSYKYRWVMHDSSTFTGQGAFKVYNNAGTYRVNLTVNDTAGNNRTTYVDVTIKEYNSLSVVVTDKSNNNARISGASVQVSNETKSTDGNGVATFSLREDTYKIKASKSDYEGASYNVNMADDHTIYMNLTYQDLSSPKITLLTGNNEMMSPDSVDLKFKADDSTSMECSLYIAKVSDSWFQLKDSGTDLLANTEYTFELRDLENEAYKWKIECSDKNDNTGYSDERRFTVSDGSIKMASTAMTGNADRINNALDSMNKMSGEESEVSDILGIKAELKDLLDRISTYDRDINDVVYRRDLDEAGKVKAQQDIAARIESMKNSIPIDIDVTESKTFVKYVRDEELKTLIDEYSALKSMKIDKKLFLESTKASQSKIIVSTSVRNVNLYFLNGEIRKITLVTKDVKVIKLEDEAPIRNSNSITFVEVIPKAIAPSAKMLNFITKEYTILKDDPIIEYPPDTTLIAYYINETIAPEKFQDADTVLIEKNTFTVKSGTGFSIAGLDSISDIELTGQGVMIIVIVVLLLFYVVINFDLIDKVRVFAGSVGWFGSKKKISFIRVLVNDAEDYLKSEDYDKAALIYREIKLSYEGSSEFIKKQVYDESFSLCNQLDYNYLLHVLEKAEYYIKIGDRNSALMEFEKLEKTYEKLGDDYRSQVTDRFKRLMSLVNGGK